MRSCTICSRGPASGPLVPDEDGLSIGGQPNVGPLGRDSVSTTTDAQGRYRMELRQGIVEVNASTRLIFDGRRYTVALHPADDRKGHEDVHNGIVNNFYLKVSGPRPGVEPRQVLTFRRQITATTRSGWYQFDIPLGRYRVEAFVSVGGAPMRPMRVKTDAQASPVGSVTADVLAHGSENDGARTSSTSANFRVEVHR